MNTPSLFSDLPPAEPTRTKCQIADCPRPVMARGWCSAHYRRWHATGDPQSGKPVRQFGRTVCSIDGCGRPVKAKGWCNRHWLRWKTHGNPLGGGQFRDGQQTYTPRLHRTGYMSVWDPARSRIVFEHRVVMEKKLGRPMWPGETAHHINGVRTDNRPENLELWVSFQPSGQRVEDLLAWAREIVKRYGA